MYCYPIFHSHILGKGVTLQARSNSLIIVSVSYMCYVVQYSARLLVTLIPLLRSMCGSGEPIPFAGNCLLKTPYIMFNTLILCFGIVSFAFQILIY